MIGARPSHFAPPRTSPWQLKFKPSHAEVDQAVFVYAYEVQYKSVGFSAQECSRSKLGSPFSMDALSKYLEESDPDFNKPEYDEQHDGFEISEVHQENGAAFFSTKRINDSMVASWLDVLSEVDDKTSQKHLVVVWIKGNVSVWPWNVEIRRETESLILERLQLKQARQIIPVSGGLVRLPENSKSRHTFALYMFERFILVWTHDMSTGRTVAVCWNDETWFPRSDFENVIEQQAALAKHPMYVGYCAAISMTRQHEGDIESNRNSIIGVEARTSHNTFYKNWTAAEGSLAALSAEMSGCTQYLACTVKELDIMREVLDLVMDDEWTTSSGPPGCADGAPEDLKGCALVLRQRLEAQQREIRYVTRRAEVQLTAVSDELCICLENQPCTSTQTKARRLTRMLSGFQHDHSTRDSR